MATTAHWTLQQREAEGGPPGPWEVVHGEMIPLAPGGFRHSPIGIVLASHLWQANRLRPTGVVLRPDAGVVIQHEPLILKVPDVAFIRANRLPADFERPLAASGT